MSDEFPLPVAIPVMLVNAEAIWAEENGVVIVLAGVMAVTIPVILGHVVQLTASVLYAP